MALFAVSRYLGEDEEVASDNRKAEASTILQKLQEAAKERRKSLGKDVKTANEKEEKTREIVSHSNNTATTLSEVTRTIEQGDSDLVKKHKKHKKHSLANESNGDLNVSFTSQDNALENNNSVDVILSKRKRKHSLERDNDTSFNKTSDEAGVEKEIKKNRKSLEHKNIVNASPSDHKKHKKDKKHKTGESVALGFISPKSGKQSGEQTVNNGDEDKVKNRKEIKENDSDSDNYSDDIDEVEMDNNNEEVATSKDGLNEVGGFTVLGNIKPTKVEKVKRVLPDWLSSPSIITADVRLNQLPVKEMLGLDADLVHKLTENGIKHFFPVQMHVIPALLESSVTGFLTGRAGYRPSDICVSAPTGSGKTLAFVLPIVQALRSRVTREVRALAVLPVRDLATQVFKVFQTYCKGTQLKVGLLIGQKTLLAEQDSLVRKRLRGYQSLFDIIVATPGRLVDHINKTEGFDLSHLRYMVIDEADRMMDEVKQDWLIQVESAVYRSRPLPTSLTAASCQNAQIPLQKLLYSATLSQNPEKLQQLNLFQPKLFTSVVKVTKPVKKNGHTKKMDEVEENVMESNETEEILETNEDKEKMVLLKTDELVGKYSTPAGLSEFYIETTAGEKPLVVLHLLHHLKYKNILCFTNSVEATHRLYLLIKLMGDVKVKKFSSGLHAAHRNVILQNFVAGKIDIIICSDAMARGMDISNVKYVISYDPPPFIQTYVHRIGRTARAGNDGVAITLLQKKEFFHFKKMVKEAGKKTIHSMSVHKNDVKPLVPKFQETLKQLSDILQNEKKTTRSKKSIKSEIKKNNVEINSK